MHMHLVWYVLTLYILTLIHMHILHSPEEFVQKSRPFLLVIMSSIQYHDKNNNLGIILQGENGCLSLFEVKGSGKVNV